MDMLEIVVVLAVAFLIVGPKDLPKVARWIARQLKSIKKLIRQLKKETGWDEFAKDIEDTTEDIKSSVKDADIREDVRMTADELRAEMEGVHADVDRLSKQIEKDMESK